MVWLKRLGLQCIWLVGIVCIVSSKMSSDGKCGVFQGDVEIVEILDDGTVFAGIIK